ncbi:helix-turn-helix domain-containing protein [Saccharomonospora sp. NPDC006951]
MKIIDSPGNARSRRTRQALLSASRDILEEGGFPALTMAAIAERAGVTRRGAYLHFTSRSAVVEELFAHIAHTEGLAESVARVWEASDAVAALREWARHVARYHVKVLAVDRAVQHVHRHDPDAAAHRDRARKAKLGNCRRLTQWLADEGRLTPAWTVNTAADMLNALTTSDLVESLLVDRAWSRRGFADHFGNLLVSTFTTGD